MIGALLEKREKYFPKCLYHSFKTPILVHKANDQYYNDNILDLYNNVCHIGHSNKQILETVTREYSKVNINSRYLNDNIVLYAERLSKYFPKGKSYKVLFVNSGSEANDLALRVSLLKNPNTKIASLKRSYHGTTYICDKVSHIYSTGKVKEQYSDDVLFVEPNNCDDLSKLEFNNVGSIILETIQGVGGNNELTKEFMQSIFDIAKKNNIITICDEVQTGFGRTGHTFWAFEYFNVFPDIITCGKPIANGYPMGAVIIREDLAELLGDFYFNTFGGNSVACAVANSVLSQLENNNYIENSKVLGNYLKQELAQINQVSNITGRGLYIGFTIDNAKEIVEKLKENNIIVGIGYNNIVRIKPPIIINKENIDQFINTLKNLL